jgi:glycosyltransferase involved in cell wall biosynthesis
MTRAGHHVALIVSSLGAGGSERVLTWLADHWARAGLRVTVVTVSGTAEDFFPVPAGVRRLALDLDRPARNPLAGAAWNAVRIARLRRTLRVVGPDVVVSFGDRTNVLVVGAAHTLPARVVVCERANPFRHEFTRGWRMLRRLAYGRADAVVAQTRPVAEWLHSFVPPERVSVIPNAVTAAHAAGPPTALDARRIVGLGRLEHGKGFDLLIRAFAAARAQPDWTLEIGGEGPERGALERLARELGVGGRVRLVGRVPDSVRFMRQASVFVLSSRAEGFPNVLLEAMVAGLACVSFDCDFGPADVIRPGVDGLLVPPGDHEALGVALARLTADPGEQRRLGGAAREVATRFSEEAILPAWDDVVFPADRHRVVARG